MRFEAAPTASERTTAKFRPPIPGQGQGQGQGSSDGPRDLQPLPPPPLPGWPAQDGASRRPTLKPKNGVAGRRPEAAQDRSGSGPNGDSGPAVRARAEVNNGSVLQPQTRPPAEAASGSKVVTRVVTKVVMWSVVAAILVGLAVMVFLKAK